MKIWIDAQLSSAIAAWINRTFENIEAESVKEVGLGDALDHEIFDQARQNDVVIISKDNNFIWDCKLIKKNPYYHNNQ